MFRFTSQLYRPKLFALDLVFFIILVQLSIAYILDYKLLFNTFFKLPFEMHPHTFTKAIQIALRCS